MDKILSTIKCPCCAKILSTPVLLPCGHSLCQEHVTEDEFTCPKCGKPHSKQQGLLVNVPLMNMIAAHVDSIDFGDVHKLAQKSCDHFEKELNKADEILADFGNFINENVTGIKNTVHLKTEEFKLLIDEAAQKLLNELDEYEKKCTANLETASFLSGVKEFKRIKNDAHEKLTAWRTYLNELKYNEVICKKTKQDCDQSASEFIKRLQSFKQAILMDQTLNKKELMNFFCRPNVQKNSKSFRLQMDSLILNDDLKEILSILLNFGRDLNLQLLYRASRDGYQANVFHSRCDNLSGTLAIIKTFGGYIFGGYTTVSWKNQQTNQLIDKSSNCVKDSNAFLFSLVNKYSFPMRLNIKYDADAVCQNASAGPIFGSDQSEIYIGSESNTNLESSSYVGNSYQAPHGFFAENDSSFAESNHFSVQELEVYRVC